MKLSRVLVVSGLLLVVGLFLAACGGSGGGSNNGNTTQPLMITSSSPLTSGTVNDPYSYVLQATGGSGTYTWSIASGSLPTGLTLNGMTAMIGGTPTASGAFGFVAQVSDTTGHTATANLTLSIEGALLITCNSCVASGVLPYGSVGAPYTAALSASGGTAPYTWCVPETNGTCDNGSGGGLPAGLTLTTDGNGNGIIAGTPTSQPAAPLNVTVQVTDSETIKATGSATFTLTIFSILTKTVPNGIINQPYKAANGQPVSVIAAGGTGTASHPYTWSVSSGSLPPGLSLCTSSVTPVCVISGTPTQLGVSNFTISVTDGQTPPAMASQALSIDVTDATLTINMAPLPMGNVNLPYSAILQATGGSGQYTWSLASGTLPAGLNLNGNSGQISGTPTTQGTSSFVIQVQDNENPPQMALSGTLTTTINAAITNALLTGNFAFAFNGYNGGTPFIMVGALIADGNGNITSGKLDRNDGHGSEINNPGQCSGNPNCPVPEVMQSGSVYDLSAGNGLGTMKIMTLDANNNQHTYKLSISVSPNACTPGQPSTSACGQLIQRDSSDPQTYGSGVLKIQNPTFFNVNAFFPGNFAVLLNGVDPSGNRYAAAGAIGTNLVTLIDVDCNGNNWHLSACPLNVNDGGAVASNPIAGSQFSANIDPQTGRGEFVNLRFPSDPNGYCLGGTNGPNCGYAYYIIDKQEMFMISSDPFSKPANLTLWTAYRQKSSAQGWVEQSLNGSVIAELTGNDNGTADTTAGLLTFTPSSGTVTFAGDENDGGTLSQPASSGTYAVGTNGNLTGNFTLSVAQDPALNNASVYLYSGGFGYFVGSDAKVTSGVLEQQSPAPFSNTSVIGTLEGGTMWSAVNGVTNSVTEMFADGAGDITATQYTSGPGGPGGPTQLTLTYSVDATGRAVVNKNGNEFGVLYVVGPYKFVLLPAGSNPALSIFISGQAD